MLIFGLTGGIATGKTAVSDMLSELGCPVIDTDILARRVVEPGRPAWRQVVQQFGEGVLLEDGRLDRPKLASMIFSSQQQRMLMNKCTHPHIQRAVMWEVAKNFILGEPFVVLVSPLLFETGTALKYVRQTIVVNCSREQQLSRVMSRDGVSEDRAVQRVQSQIPLDSKCLWADVVIDNSYDLATTRRQVERLVAGMRHISYCRRFVYYGLVSVPAVLLLACVCAVFYYSRL